MWWKLGGVAIVTAALLAILMWPTKTTTISFDLPPGASAPSSSQIESASPFVTLGVSVLVVAIILGIAGWFSWRIIRHHRASPDQG